MKKLLILITSLTLISCSTNYRIIPEYDNTPLDSNEGYLGVVFNTSEPLEQIKFTNKDRGTRFYEGKVDKGIHQVTLKVPEGEYCLIGFEVGRIQVDNTQLELCTYVEANKVNYLGEFEVQSILTFASSNFPRYVFLLAKEYPNICSKYLGDGCLTSEPIN